MKPPPFEYRAPRSLDEALELLADDGREARALAGGQSLIPVMNFRLASPDLLVDLNGVAELGTVDMRPDGGLSLGAMVRQRTLERDPRVAAAAPLLAEAAAWIAHPQIRSRGTVGGSVAHADPAAELPAVLLALGATVHATRLAGVDGSGGRAEREIPLGELFLGPFFTTLEPGELITRIEVPPPAPREGTAFEEVARRRGDYAIVGAAARVRLDEAGRCEEAALVLVNAGPVPMAIDGAAAELVGAPPTPDRIEAAAAAAASECDPATDMHGSEAYRRHLAAVLARRTLGRAATRAGAPDPGRGP